MRTTFNVIVWLVRMAHPTFCMAAPPGVCVPFVLGSGRFANRPFAAQRRDL